MAEHIEFADFGRSISGKTRRWKVVAKDGGGELGTVNWFGRWRCYAFDPRARTVYEKTCRRDIADFCEQQTKDHQPDPRGEGKT